MAKEKTITELYEVLQGMQKDVLGMRKDMATKNDLEEMKKNIATKKDLEEIKKNMATTGELHELYKFLQVNMVMKEDFAKLEKDVNGLKVNFSGLEKKVTHIENQMVTKSYLDEKLVDLKGDLTVLMRKEDKKLSRLIEMLKNKKIIGEGEAQELFNMEPFPSLVM